MNFTIPRYSLVETQLSLAYPESEEKEWIFNTSEEYWQATGQYNNILEQWDGFRGLTSELRKFLNRYPWHFEAMSKYASCKLDDGKKLDGFAFAQTAVCLARNSFPTDFVEGKHRIPGGYMDNRPFLRALAQLMVAYSLIGAYSDAVKTGFQILHYDQDDRTGSRMELPKYLLKLGRNLTAIALFEDPLFEGNFQTSQYLYPVALLNAEEKEKALSAIDDCLLRPRIAKYLLNPHLPPPEPEKRPFFGIISGSELEGFYYAMELREFWASNKEALSLLRERSYEAEAQGWPAYLKSKPFPSV